MNAWYHKGVEAYGMGVAFAGSPVDMTDKQFRFWAYGWQAAHEAWLETNRT